MKEEFVLWVDESGTFKNQRELRISRENYSLVGGLLFKKKDAERVMADIDKILASEEKHANEVPDKEKYEFTKNYWVPNILKLKKTIMPNKFFLKMWNILMVRLVRPYLLPVWIYI
ncbi:MAG: hypothetical protein K6E85_17005 [Lachnospiraceae bacterium]|nr:hypothetical protein [Lachnospiraceae bacterium]